MKILLRESQLVFLAEQESKPIIRKIKENDIKEIYPHLSEVFHKTKYSSKIIWEMIKEEYNPNLSVVLTLGDKVIGFYFIGNGQIPETENPVYDDLKTMEGVEGIALGILPYYKELGLGKMLITWSQSLPFDYIWGAQFRSLENIHDWKKRRKVYYVGPEYYITYQILNNKGHQNSEKEKEKEIGETNIGNYRPLFSEFN